MKILIRKAKTENSLKKDILTSLTLSKNSVKTKNVFSIITLFSASPRNSWIYSKTLEKNILRKETHKAQITVRSKIMSSVADSEVVSLQSLKTTSFKLSEKHKLLNSLAFNSVGQIINPQYSQYRNLKLDKLRSSFILRSNFVKSILKSQKVYYNVPSDRQFSLSRFNKSFLKVKQSTDRISLFLENWYSVLKNHTLTAYSSNLQSPHAIEVTNNIHPLVLASSDWLTHLPEKKKQVLAAIEFEIQKCKINTDFSLELNYVSPFKTKNLPHINLNVIKLSRYYMYISSRTFLFTQGLVANKLPKLINPAILILNFRKSRFFPSLTNLKGRLFSTMSLGMFSKFFNKGKSFIKNKSVFLLIAGFLRKLILFSEIKGAMLQVKRVPLYFKEILSALHDPVVSFYKNPFTGQIINESEEKNTFKFTSFMFINNKPYGKVKNKQKGRLKRKITKRLISINRMVD